VERNEVRFKKSLTYPHGVFNLTEEMRKTTVLESLDKLPDEFSIDEIIERLIILEKIDKGRQEVKDGKTNTEEEAKAKLSKWLN
jgi:hypothetical protein